MLAALRLTGLGGDALMRRELYASAGIHAAILLWVAIGGSLFRATDETEFQVTGVQIISTAEFEELTQSVSFETPQAPSTPEAPEALTPAPQAELPEPPEQETAAPEVSEPIAPVTPPVETPPQIVEPDPIPQTEVTDQVAALAAPPQGDPNSAPSDTPVPQEAPRVAPTPAPAPPPDVETAPDVVEQPSEPEEADIPVEEIVETAPEEATTEIVTEAETPSASNAPRASSRPTARPARPTPPPTPEVETAADAPAPETPDAAEAEPQQDSMADAIAAAVADAAANPSPAAPSGPPLTQGEVDGLIADVRACWNVGSLSSEAQRTIVTISVQMAADGRPESGSIRMIASEGGSDAAARQAFEAGRRAILRCGANGFDLPQDKYDHWATIEMVFNPEQMRLR